MHSVQNGILPVSPCVHTDHLFQDWSCPEYTLLGKIAAVVFHILTLCIPLLLYHGFKFADYTFFSVSEEQPPPVDMPVRRAPAVELFLRRAAEVERDKREDEEIVPRPAQEPEEESVQQIVPGARSRSPDTDEKVDEEIDFFVESEQERQSQREINQIKAWMQNLFAETIDRRGMNSQEFQGWFQNVDMGELKDRIFEKFAEESPFLLSLEVETLPADALIQGSFSAALQNKVIAERVEQVCQDAVRHANYAIREVEPYDWHDLGVQSDHEHFFMVSLPSRESLAALDDSYDGSDSMVSVQPVPENISRMYNLYLQKFDELKQKLTIRTNVPVPIEDFAAKNLALELVQIAYATQLALLQDLREYPGINPEDYPDLLTNRHFYFSKAINALGGIYHVIRSQSYFDTSTQRFVSDMQSLPRSWHHRFFSDPTSPRCPPETKMRLLFNAFCVLLYNFLGEDKWDILGQLDPNLIDQYLPDDDPDQYAPPGLIQD